MTGHGALLTQRQAAEYLSVSIRALQRWRARGLGPASIVLPTGHRRDLDAWLARHGDRPGA